MEEEINMGKLIHDKLNENDRSVAWLAKKVYRSPSALCKLLKHDTINHELLLRISKVLDYNFFSCYSDHLGDSELNNKKQP
jgi:plasmid maintenance system antidote protein VapI